jgi:hypothetical protein
MNAPIEFESAQPCALPAQLRSLLKPPRLLPGESLADYVTIRQMIIDEVAPQTSIEWLWTIDLIELSWDVVRYRSLRQKVVETYRKEAVESLLYRVDSFGIPTAALEMAKRQTRRNVEQWRADATAGAEIEAHLKSYGIDATSINVEVFVQARDLFLLFDSLMHSAQSRRIVLLREIAARRAISRQVHGRRMSISASKPPIRADRRAD